MTKSHCFLIVMILGFSYSNSGAEGLLEAYQQAAASDPQLLQAAANRQARQEAKPQARALQLPSISANASVSRNHLDETSGDADFTSNSRSISLNQSLYNRGNRVRVRQADITVQQADIDYRTAEQDLVLRVAQRYFDVLSAQDDRTFTEAEKSAIERQLEQAKRRFEVGLITITDVQEAQARFDASVAAEIDAINQVADTKEALHEVTGQFYDQLRILSERMPLTPPEPADPQQWVDNALQNSPILLSAALAADNARENIDLQRSDRYPTVDLNTSYSGNDSGASDSRGGAVGLQFSVPIYLGGSITSRTREAAFQHEAAKEFLEQQQRATVRQIRDAYRGIEASISRIKALDQSRISSKSALEATEAGFEVGTRTIVDVLDAQRDLFSAERNYSQARYAYILNRLSLSQAAGEIGEADIELIETWLDNAR